MHSKKSDEELQQYLQYKLVPFPLSHFPELGMRKGTKSLLYKAFIPLTSDTQFGSSVHILDGGFLLHKVVWQCNELYFTAISTYYIIYVTKHYGSNSNIVFDGYAADAAIKSTKTGESLQKVK